MLSDSPSLPQIKDRSASVHSLSSGGTTIMNNIPSQNTNSVNTDPLVLYSRSLHHYTLGLWTESRRLAEARASTNAKQKEEAEGKKQRGRSHP